MVDISGKYEKSIPTIRKYFDLYDVKVSKYQKEPSYKKHNRKKKQEKEQEKERKLPITNKHVNLVFDATFFSRSYGILVFRANGKNIYAKVIDAEKIYYVEESLNYLNNLDYTFKSFTIDGRKGVVTLLKKLYPNIPIQLCQFHQSQIIRRYTTNNPKTECGRELKVLMATLTLSGELDFAKDLFLLRKKYEDFLKERNENNRFKHKRLRSAFRSLKTNLPYLFTCKNYPDLQIPNTTNSCDGSFAHWKSKVKIHRGLRKDRREKMIMDLIKKC